MQIGDYLLCREDYCWGSCAPRGGCAIYFHPHSPGLRLGLPSRARFAGFAPSHGITAKRTTPHNPKLTTHRTSFRTKTCQAGSEIVPRSEQFVPNETCLTAHAPLIPARMRVVGDQLLTSRLPDIARHYQLVLADDSRNPEALAAMSLVALASRQPEAAVTMATAAVAAAPRMGAAWVALGQALKAADRHAEAKAAYDSGHPARRDGSAGSHGHGRAEDRDRTVPQEAIREFELALQRDPAMVPAHLGLGHALAMHGPVCRRPAPLRAGPCAAAAAGRRPNLPPPSRWPGWGGRGRPKPATAGRSRRRPDFAAAWINLGCLLREQGRECVCRSRAAAGS